MEKTFTGELIMMPFILSAPRLQYMCNTLFRDTAETEYSHLGLWAVCVTLQPILWTGLEDLRHLNWYPNTFIWPWTRWIGLLLHCRIGPLPRGSTLPRAGALWNGRSHFVPCLSQTYWFHWRTLFLFSFQVLKGLEKSLNVDLTSNIDPPVQI